MKQKFPFDAAIVADLNGRVLFWSGAAETMFGLSAGEAAGRPVSSFFEQWPDFARRADGTTFRSSVREETWKWRDSELSLITIHEHDHESAVQQRDELQLQLEEARRVST